MISEGNLAGTLDENGFHLGNNLFYDNEAYMIGIHADKDDSITKSYNQRVKEETSFLKKRRIYDEGSQQDNSYHEKYETDILYNLGTR